MKIQLRFNRSPFFNLKIYPKAQGKAEILLLETLERQSSQIAELFPTLITDRVDFSATIVGFNLFESQRLQKI